MKIIGQLFLGLLTAVGSSVIVLAAASLALLEGNARPALIEPTTLEAVSTLPVPGSTPSPTRQVLLTATQSQPIVCVIPEGWQPYTIQTGDTLDSVSARAGESPDHVYKINCLLSSSLPVGHILYLPNTRPTDTPLPALPTVEWTKEPTATATPTATAVIVQPTREATTSVCTISPPSGWVVYIVRSGDTLSKISRDFDVNLYQLMAVNCLSSDKIQIGQRMYVPYRPTRTPTEAPTEEPEPPTPTDTETPTETPTATFTVIPTATETPTASPMPTETGTPTTQPNS